MMKCSLGGASSSSSKPPDSLNCIKPNLVQQEIYRAMEAGEAKNFRRMGEATASAMGVGGEGGPSIPEQIEQLDALRRAGTITDEEFEAKKRELLDRM